MSSPLGPYEVEDMINQGPYSTIKDVFKNKEPDEKLGEESPTTPEESTPPPKEVGDSPKEVDIEDFAEYSSRPDLFKKEEKKPVEPDKKPEEQKEEKDEKGVDTKTEETKTEEEETTEETKKGGTEELPPTARPKRVAADDRGMIDEEGFSETERKLFSQMSNTAKDYFKGRIQDLNRVRKETEELKTKAEKSSQGELPPTWYQHEEAYLLDPSFKQASQLADRVQGISEHFVKQLALARGGEEWIDLEQDPQGNILQVKRESSPAAEAVILQKLTAANAYAQQQRAIAEAVKSNFGGRVKTAFEEMRKTEDHYFPQYASEEDIKDNADIKIMQERLRSRNLDGDILAGFLTKLYAHAIQVMKESDEKDKMIDKLKKTKELQAKVEPSSREVVGSASTKPSSPAQKPFDMAAFERIKAGY